MQCEWAPVDYLKPTGVLTNSSHFFKDARFHVGWPQFTQEPGSTWRSYAGPLPSHQGAPQCSHGEHHPLRGRDASGSWATAPAAAYPPELCQAVARALLKSELETGFPNGPSPTLKTGTLKERAGSETRAVTDFPVRTHLMQETLADPTVLYVGRGAPSLGLPRSRWANPSKIAREVTRATSAQPCPYGRPSVRRAFLAAAVCL